MKGLCSEVESDEARIMDYLTEVLQLIEQFSGKRSKGDKAWLPRALDVLDREGVFDLSSLLSIFDDTHFF